MKNVSSKEYTLFVFGLFLIWFSSFIMIPVGIIGWLWGTMQWQVPVTAMIIFISMAVVLMYLGQKYDHGKIFTGAQK